MALRAHSVPFDRSDGHRARVRTARQRADQQCYEPTLPAILALARLVTMCSLDVAGTGGGMLLSGDGCMTGPGCGPWGPLPWVTPGGGEACTMLVSRRMMLLLLLVVAGGAPSLGGEVGSCTTGTACTAIGTLPLRGLWPVLDLRPGEASCTRQ